MTNAQVSDTRKNTAVIPNVEFERCEMEELYTYVASP